MLGLCFSKHGCFSFFKKLLFNSYIFTSLFSIDIKNHSNHFLRSFKGQWVNPFKSLRNCPPHEALCSVYRLAGPRD